MGESNTNTPSDDQSTAREPSITVLIHEAIATQKKSGLNDCPPLYDVVNPDALDKLFAPTRKTERHGTVTFKYCGFQVTVNADRTVELEPIDAKSS